MLLNKKSIGKQFSGGSIENPSRTFNSRCRLGEHCPLPHEASAPLTGSPLFGTDGWQIVHIKNPEFAYLQILSSCDNIATRYYPTMIASFASTETEKIFHGKISKKLPKDIQRTARRKLIYLDDAEDLQDLLAPPGNRLEKLKGDRAGQHSIRINDQWRICFKWSGNKARDVEIVDYHG